MQHQKILGHKCHWHPLSYKGPKKIENVFFFVFFACFTPTVLTSSKEFEDSSNLGMFPRSNVSSIHFSNRRGCVYLSKKRKQQNKTKQKQCKVIELMIKLIYSFFLSPTKSWILFTAYCNWKRKMIRFYPGTQADWYQSSKAVTSTFSTSLFTKQKDWMQ